MTTMTTNTNARDAEVFRIVFKKDAAAHVWRMIRAAALFTDKKSIRECLRSVQVQLTGAAGKVRICGTDGHAAFVGAVRKPDGCATPDAEGGAFIPLSLIDKTAAALKAFGAAAKGPECLTIVRSGDRVGLSVEVGGCPDPIGFHANACYEPNDFKRAVRDPLSNRAPDGYGPEKSVLLARVKYLEAACKAAKVLQIERGVLPRVGLCGQFRGGIELGEAIAVAPDALVLIAGLLASDDEKAPRLSRVIPAVFGE